MSKEYITLEDFIKDNSSIQMIAALPSLELGNATMVGASTFLNTLIAQLTETTIPTELSSTEANTLLCRYIYPKYRKMAIAYAYEDENIDSIAKDWFLHLLNRILTSYDEYKLLIDTFSTEKAHLMDGIKSKTQSKFNDTPQVYSSTGEVSYNDNYNSTVTTNYTDLDGATKIARINEIERLIKDYYGKWCDYVCGGMFIYE